MMLASVVLVATRKSLLGRQELEKRCPQPARAIARACRRRRRRLRGAARPTDRPPTRDARSFAVLLGRTKALVETLITYASRRSPLTEVPAAAGDVSVE